MRGERKIIIIAGPNGAGKTTFARQFLPREADCPIFINADLIAAGLSPFRPQAAALRAGRLLLAEIAAHATRRESFAFETTLAGRGLSCKNCISGIAERGVGGRARCRPRSPRRARCAGGRDSQAIYEWVG